MAQALGRINTEPAVQPQVERPRPLLLFFESAHSGRCRRVQGFLAQVLQRRHNHDTFKLVRVDVDQRPELATRFGVERVPAVLVVEDKRVRLRLESPRGCRELEEALRPWLR
jgi:thioredoxin-like negative regulator of GroEL